MADKKVARVNGRGRVAAFTSAVNVGITVNPVTDDGAFSVLSFFAWTRTTDGESWAKSFPDEAAVDAHGMTDAEAQALAMRCRRHDGWAVASGNVATVGIAVRGLTPDGSFASAILTNNTASAGNRKRFKLEAVPELRREVLSSALRAMLAACASPFGVTE